MSDNVYETPEATLETSVEVEQGYELASRWERLGAAIIDGLIMSCMAIPFGLLATYYAVDLTELMYELVIIPLLGVTIVGIYLAINYNRLMTRGQTLGKSALKIAIADNQTKNLPAKNKLLTRYCFSYLCGYIPFVGSLFSLINVCFIFGSEKRCIHDHVASTCVVKRTAD